MSRPLEERLEEALRASPEPLQFRPLMRLTGEMSTAALREALDALHAAGKLERSEKPTRAAKPIYRYRWREQDAA